jgi:hypothetical protein
MKTLEMLFKAEKDGKLYKHDGLYYSKLKGFVDKKGSPWKAYAFSTINDLIHDEGHYSDGWKEVIKVSDDEKIILRNLKGEWLAKDYDGELCCYTIKPEKNGTTWYGEDDYSSLSALDHLFQMVKWEDEEPTLIADLLKG